MEPPSKRPRLSIPDPDPALLADHDDDETNPVDLEAARARNDQRLKSIFESIFEKYEKDFTEVGDEIDLQSGRIIVNNGHLQRMEGEDDTGEKDAEWLAGLATPVVDHREEESGSETETGGDGYEEDAAAAAASGGSRLWSGSRRSLPADGALEGIRDDEPTGATDADADAGEYTDAYCDGNYDEGEDEDEDDDTSSVDSLLDAATSVHHADNNRPAQVTARTHTTTIPITEKAIPGSEAAGAFSRIRAADYYIHLNSTSDEQEPVDSKWRVPEIDAKFVTPTTWSRTLPISPSSNNTKQESKTNAVRSASPPGARSLWALPHPGRPRKTNTDVPYQKKKRNTDASNKKERNTDAPNQKERNAAIPNQKKNNTGAFNQEERDTDIPNQKKKDTDVLNQKERNKDISASAKKVPLDAPPPTSIGQPKPKPFLSPVVANDWSFAAASDGSESDDPLQEDHQPSPTPKTVLNIRGKRIGSSAPLSGSQSRCNGCKGLFSSNDDHVLHLRSVLASNLPDTLHDRTIVKKILERIDEAHARDTDSRPKSIDSPPAHESPGNPGSPEIPGNPASPGSPGSPGSSASPGSPTPKDTVINENQSATIKPKQKKGKYAPITPSDAKILITMRHVQKKQWKEILEYIPGKRSKNLMQWNKFHWVERRTHPPQLSRPWSLDEREKLSAFVDPQGMTWPGIRAELAGRSSAEIECEIFRLWVGDEVWNSEEGQPVESKGHHYQDQRKGDNGDLDTSAATNLEGVALADQDEPNSDVDSTVGDYLEIPDSTESSVIGADLEDIHDLYNLEPNPEYSKMLHSGQKSISPEPYNAGRRIITLKYGRKR